MSKLPQFLPLFTSEGFSPGTWHHDPGEFSWFEYSPDVVRFLGVVGSEGWIQPFDWRAWKDEAQKVIEDPAAVAGIDRDTIQKLLTLHVRADRFNEGHIAGMFTNGHIVAILRRLEALQRPPT